MIIVMKNGVSAEQIDEVVKHIKLWGAQAHVDRGETQTVIGVIGDKAEILRKPWSSFSGVEKTLEVSDPFKKASRKFHPSDSVFEIAGEKIGGGSTYVIAGPCSVDTEEYVVATAKAVKAAGAQALRGGAFKPRTSPYTFQGSGEDGLKILQTAKQETGLPIVTEAMSVDQVDLIYKYADVIQIGARNAQNFNLLKAVGKMGKPVILKNGIATTAKEHLMSAEYIMSEGLKEVILCLRGTRSYETAFRNSLDVALIPYLQELSHLPVIVDSSHSTGVRSYVSAVAYAGMAAGADGLILEVHPNPCEALSDGEQALLPSDFDFLMKKLGDLKAWSQKEWKKSANQNLK
ncbi:MAG: 3-deoxy-7-phosphoheptulonate synthase [Helicobacteraceae bacterium]|jgi:3-deoxy-7-phosphoheptulonate synthase|nr:3-deoxy-7-phosphoheptulonate synthase [Helicobacteraceae bacterium]